ncbi:hexameric tyrosine-coordinated heme protein [Aquisalimonas sp.]|uniref:hexameric tyrosine-coordinated heme protein n=1 Tax=Aquisalimonas sp. TaxID=1872621 RepID=UPI0025C3D3F5|nr:hexameric tyrosine-coordinated heme protein [Aquisalimonas sp.]
MQSPGNSFFSQCVVAAALALLVLSPVSADDDKPQDGLQSLITETPQEGFELALSLARKGVTSTQTDRDILFDLREQYSRDPDSLIAASHVVAVHFRTVAEANDYWRD